ncbi:MAG: adenosine deaminase family protein [Deltaproteobacteria bacterium]|nr:adenosine deaminase family protein [Deltaproteobacteria bacterium]
MTEPVVLTRELLRELPKTDLHLHLDGSMRLATLIDLARAYRVPLPSETEQGLKECVFKDSYADLGEYLAGFRYTAAVLQSESALERVAYELAEDNQAEGVRYIEVRFAPQLHIHTHMDATAVLRAVNRGLHRARDDFNRRPEVLSGVEPPFEYGIIVCALRMFESHYSEYYGDLLRVHRYAQPRRAFALASLELAEAAVRIRDELGIPIVGFDLAGEELGYPAEDHQEAYHWVHKNFLKKTVHAGEAYGPESIFQAITDLHADRIGHGFYLMDASMIRDPAIKDRQRYIDALVQYIADRRITVEVCLTSNMQTNPAIGNLSNHALRNMRDVGLSVTICTDNRLVSNTTVTRELELATQFIDDGYHLKQVIIYGFKRSFFPGSYLRKRKYVRRIIDYYEQVEEKHRRLQGEAGATPVPVSSKSSRGLEG